MTLPWPPSVNSYWRHPTRGPLAGRHLISEEGRKFRNYVCDFARVNGITAQFDGRLAITVRAYPPDRRRRDLDNILKATLDSLTHAAVIEDDSQFDDIRIVRQSLVKGGKLEIMITELENL